MSGLETYFYFVFLTNFKIVCCIASVVLGSSIFFLLLFANDNFDELLEYKKKIPILSISLLVCLFFNVILPSEKQIAAVIAIPAITQNDKIQNMTSNGLKLLDEKFLEWLEDIKK